MRRDKVKAAAYQRAWVSKNRERWNEMQKHYQRKYNHGLTREDYTVMLEKQRGLCAICYAALKSVKSCVDHDHDTGKIRGLICHKCNVGLGLFRDSTNFLRGAIAYLENNGG